jgi:hypothetical protein
MLHFNVFPIRSNDGRWYIVSAFIPISFANPGARPGKVLSMRIIATFPKANLPRHRDVLHAVFQIDADGQRDASKPRFEWLDLYATPWLPFVVLPKATVSQLVLFEKRWDRPIVQDQMHLVLEGFTDTARRWKRLAEWDVPLDRKTWSIFLNEPISAIGFGVTPKSHPDDESSRPENLNELIGTDEPLPGPKSGPPSYLDYPRAGDRSSDDAETEDLDD